MVSAYSDREGPRESGHFQGMFLNFLIHLLTELPYRAERFSLRENCYTPIDHIMILGLDYVLRFMLSAFLMAVEIAC